MCLGVPYRILSVDGIAATATDGTHIELLDLSLLRDITPGTWVLAFLGTAREVLTDEQASQITAALGGLRSLMQGGDLGDAFADIEGRAPTLPPHLEAARLAGKSVA